MPKNDEDGDEQSERKYTTGIIVEHESFRGGSLTCSRLAKDERGTSRIDGKSWRKWWECDWSQAQDAGSGKARIMDGYPYPDTYLQSVAMYRYWKMLLHREKGNSVELSVG